MRLLLVRHGQSEANVARRIQGQGDGELTERGRHEARLLAERLANGGPVQAIYTSPLKRAAETAAVIGERLDIPPVILDDLREMHLGAIDGLNGEESRVHYPEVLRRWAEDDLTLVFPDGEPVIASYQRGVEVMQRIVKSHPDDTVAVVTHGGLLASYLSYILDGQFSIKRVYELRNCGLTELDFDATGQVKVGRYNDDTHLAVIYQAHEASGSGH